MLAIKNVTFSYTPDVPVLHDISLTFDSRTTAIIGQNGTGKTTLVKLIKGLLTCQEGSIEIEGKEIKDLKVSEIAKDIGLVFQNPNDQIFKNKVRDEIEFGPLNIGKSKEETTKLANDAMALLGIAELADKNPYDLGLSERKLISIASILAMDTKVIILDEPTIAQDYKGKQLIKNVIKKLQAEGKLVIAILHDMDFVAETFDRAVVMKKGRILLDDSVKIVFSQAETLEEAYLEAPSIVKLSQELGEEDIYLTVEEFLKSKGKTAY